jgi:hypothetical protein
VSSNRRFMPGFYRITCAPPKPTHRSKKQALGGIGDTASETAR